MPAVSFYLVAKRGKLIESVRQIVDVGSLLEGRTLTRESNSEFTPRVSKLPTFPLLGF